MATSCNVILQGSKLAGRRDETLAAAATIYPGHVIEVASATTCQKQSTANGQEVLCVALEQQALNKATSDAYAAGDRVIRYFPQAGEEFYCRVAAAATAITVGAKLGYNAGGTLKVYASGKYVAEAVEAVDNSGGGTEVFCLVRAY